ncbi:MAG: SDR family oxidoreductase [Saprospiraceae bacterium]|jgi:dehydrogenase/reductase SDR family protein 7B|nr:SDR family oxidoreductase [Candidatus Brachybacter algidus]MBP9845860.1 SDR family oxidoreductase [Saprospiraceae bacterium]MBK6450699.1 SDR family oxidoreductase [Candidatus Brachybacter algidus]MBK7605433.1 SDR family oxidoreductase [Candidatus Brachybacter algidus]MBK8356308.1 SDR family oxidoreductase [Candidatus Brachybacter algidus]
MDIKDKWVWITGASSGIGRALAIEFSYHGCNLVLLSRNIAELEVTAGKCNPNIKAIIQSIDLSDPTSITGAVAHLRVKNTPLDILVNNGGISQRSAAIETQDGVARKIFDINYFGTVNLTKALLPQMIEKGGGQIAVITSLVGIIGSPKRTSYAASKHALHGYFDSLRAELFNEKIKVTIICPGFIRTNISLSAVTGDGQAQNKMDEKTDSGMEPSKLAKIAVKGIANQKEEIYIGGKEILAIYLKRFVPGIFSRILRNAKVT